MYFFTYQSCLHRKIQKWTPVLQLCVIFQFHHKSSHMCLHKKLVLFSGYSSILSATQSHKSTPWRQGANRGAQKTSTLMPFPLFSAHFQPLHPPKTSDKAQTDEPVASTRACGAGRLHTDFIHTRSDRKRALRSRNASLISKTHSPARHIESVAISQ